MGKYELRRATSTQGRCGAVGDVPACPGGCSSARHKVMRGGATASSSLNLGAGMGFGGVCKLPDIVCKLWRELSVECYVASSDFEKNLCPSKCGIALESWQLLLWATPNVTRVNKLFASSYASVVAWPWVVGDALTPGSPTWKVTPAPFLLPWAPCPGPALDPA